MNAALTPLLSRYNLQTADEYRVALREIVQHIALVGLWRAKFFEHACFYGGTALRILHGLPRYSEDMDFSLMKPDPGFSLDSYARGLEDELRSFGFTATVEREKKAPERRTESAFVKSNTLQSMLNIEAPAHITERTHRDERLKVKLEVDTDPPPYAESEVRSLLVPIPFQVRLYSPAFLFAGKAHALLCRSWKSRLKGRDFFDFIWFVGMKIPCDLKHLSARMAQSGHLKDNEVLKRDRLVELLRQRFTSVDIGKASEDVRPFLTDPQSVQIWSVAFFHEVAEQIRVV